ncbi:Tat pathway signal protein [Brevundimonas sp.]|uniref:Tat pathway signal protein n=1 Tax=Brevundimonas sp. TaxID=1871086 RepID=UPI001DC2BE70|nr:Tat pathway signal protein [Brevundimonas sp.]MBL0947997.1 Tat pathway signal protein [Brevundimonas sp.]
MTGGGGGGGSRPTYIAIGTSTANFSGTGGRRGVLTVETGLDVADAALHTRASQSAPRLRAAYNQVIARVAAGLRGDAPPDVERLARELQAATDQALGRSGARLLLGTVMAF